MRFSFEPRYKTPCDEMIKLRHGLDERGIKWRDESETKIVQIYRTKFDAAGYFFSVIWGARHVWTTRGAIRVYELCGRWKRRA